MDLYKCYQNMLQQKVCLELNGMISQEILVGFVEMIEAKLVQEAENRRTIKKVFSVFIELAQNILHYSAETIVSTNGETKIGTGIVVLCDENDHYVVSSGNLVDNGKVSRLIEQCDKINSMDRQELKQFYKEQLRSQRKEGSCGAGLGLIDMVRKSGNPLDYKVNHVDSDYSFWTTSVKIQKEA